MKVLSLRGIKRIELEKTRWIQLEYYISEEKGECENNKIYGIAIVKKESSLEELELVNGISYDQQIVEDMILTLMNNIVTPMGLIESVDEMVTVRMCG